jgi:hypothetical protein
LQRKAPEEREEDEEEEGNQRDRKKETDLARDLREIAMASGVVL